MLSDHSNTQAEKVAVNNTDMDSDADTIEDCSLDEMNGGHDIHGGGIRIDTSKVQKKFLQCTDEDESLCTICGKHVYQMEKVKAEKRLYHKTCFRCLECNKALNVDSVNTHEGDLFCHIHFKLLFQPKVNFENDDVSPRKQRRNEMIIRENIPQELPPDVIRSDSKVDDGLENYQLDLGNIRQRFESGSDDRSGTPLSLSDTNALKRSESILIRLQRYQTAILGERNMSLNGEENEHTPSESSEEGENLHHHHHHNNNNNNNEIKDIIKESKRKEKIAFSGMSSLKSKWENGAPGVNNASSENREEGDESVTPGCGGSAGGGHPSNADDTKEQLYRLRQRICVGRSASLRQVYEKACHDSASADGHSSAAAAAARSDSLHLECSVKAISLKEKFERGQIENDTEEELRRARRQKEKEDDLSVVAEAETAAREAKNIFKRMDAGLGKSQTVGNVPLMNGAPTTTTATTTNNRRFSKPDMEANSQQKQQPGDIVKCADPGVKEEVQVENAKVAASHRFFETFKETRGGEHSSPKRFEMTPPRDTDMATDGEGPEVDQAPPRDPNIVRWVDPVEDLPKSDTAKKMLNMFKQMESMEADEQPKAIGPKPLKRITPPREFTVNNDPEDEEERGPTPPRDPTIVRSSYKNEDVIPVEPEKARSLKAKFENWSQEQEQAEQEQKLQHQAEKQTGEDGAEDQECVPQSDTTKNLRAMFESIKDDNAAGGGGARVQERPKPRVNRFVNEMNNMNGNESGCSICTKRMYPMEKLEFSGLKLHKNCFRCTYCSSSLRLDNYTLAAGKLYCLHHFKQLFMAKGNYDEGFGEQQHKEKWSKPQVRQESDFIVCDANDNQLILDAVEAN